MEPEQPHIHPTLQPTPPPKAVTPTQPTDRAEPAGTPREAEAAASADPDLVEARRQIAEGKKKAADLERLNRRLKDMVTHVLPGGQSRYEEIKRLAEGLVTSYRQLRQTEETARAAGHRLDLSEARRGVLRAYRDLQLGEGGFQKDMVTLFTGYEWDEEMLTEEAQADRDAGAGPSNV